MKKRSLSMNWELRKLEEIGGVYSGSTPSTSVPDFWDGSITWITPNDLSKLPTPYISHSARTISEKGLRSSSTHLLPARSIVISSRAPIGYVAIPLIAFCTNQGCKSIELKEGYNSEFVYYNLNFHVDKLKTLGNGTTFTEITKTALCSVELPFPKQEEEQASIAAVLSCIDREIEQTEAVIAKHQRVKMGLMQDLLTKGIDNQGNIRSEATHELKDSPLGKIPTEWEAQRVGVFLERVKGFVQTGPFGSQLHAYEYLPEGVPVIMPQDISDDEVSTSQIAKVSESKAAKLSRHRVRLNDLVFARRGDLSRVAGISDREVGWLCGTGCLLMRVGLEKLNASWFATAYRFYLAQRQVEALAVGSTMPNLNTSVISNLFFAFPSVGEQDTIMRSLSAQEMQTKRTAEYRDKLLSLKQGLMQDLLTGVVKVENLLATVQRISGEG